jgi:hypothetical protein
LENPLADVIPLYTAITDYEARAAFVGPLRIDVASLDRIVGKIELPAKPESAWAHCGLNGCNTAHRFGYVIRTKDGSETNCGRDCGKREFGVRFEEVEARAKRVEESAARRRAAMEIVLQAPGWLNQMRELFPLVKREESRMAQFTNDFQQHKSFWSELTKLAKGSGHIQASRWSEDGYVNETLGRLDGCTVLLKSRLWSSNTIQERLIPWLDGLNVDSLEVIDEPALVDLVRRAENVQRPDGHPNSPTCGHPKFPHLITA